ncbi:MAG: hypothetical protein DRQ55_15465 [Planctomycetota bacterium]|nr:MAG: hypothetical protein DRQ55_15465 [Planctomycetota bacterium]
MGVLDAEDAHVGDLAPRHVGGSGGSGRSGRSGGSGGTSVRVRHGLQEQSVGPVQVQGELPGVVELQLLQTAGRVSKILEAGGREQRREPTARSLARTAPKALVRDRSLSHCLASFFGVEV